MGPPSDDVRRSSPSLRARISKTGRTNARGGTPEEIETVYLEGWRMASGDRDLPRQLEAFTAPDDGQEEREGVGAWRRRCCLGLVLSRSRTDAASQPSVPRSRTSSTISGHEGYITVGLYEDGQPGESSSDGKEAPR